MKLNGGKLSKVIGLIITTVEAKYMELTIMDRRGAKLN